MKKVKANALNAILYILLCLLGLGVLIACGTAKIVEDPAIYANPEIPTPTNEQIAQLSEELALLGHSSNNSSNNSGNNSSNISELLYNRGFESVENSKPLGWSKTCNDHKPNRWWGSIDKRNVSGITGDKAVFVQRNSCVTQTILGSDAERLRGKDFTLTCRIRALNGGVWADLTFQDGIDLSGENEDPWYGEYRPWWVADSEGYSPGKWITPNDGWQTLTVSQTARPDLDIVNIVLYGNYRKAIFDDCSLTIHEPPPLIITSDTSDPEITINRNPDPSTSDPSILVNGWYTDTIEFSYSCEDNIPDNIDNSLSDLDTDSYVESGEFTAAAYCTDNSGNRVDFEEEVKVDLDAPTIHEEPAITYDGPTRTFTYTFTCSDDHSGIDDSETSLVFDLESSETIEVVCADLAGNTSTFDFTPSIIETLVPLYIGPTIIPNSNEYTVITPSSVQAGQWPKIETAASDTPITLIVGPSNNSHLDSANTVSYTYDSSDPNTHIYTNIDPSSAYGTENVCVWDGYQNGTLKDLNTAGVDTVGYVRTAYNNLYFIEGDNGDYQNWLDANNGLIYFPYVTEEAIKANIDRFKDCDDLDGIFFDEVVLNTQDDVDFYERLCAYAETLFPNGKFILNPGTFTKLAITNISCSTVVVYEQDVATWQGFTDIDYQDSNTDNPATSVIFHSDTATDGTVMQAAVDKAYDLNIDYVYVNNDPISNGNPWDTLGTDMYFDALIDYIAEKNGSSGN